MKCGLNWGDYELKTAITYTFIYALSELKAMFSFLDGDPKTSKYSGLGRFEGFLSVTRLVFDGGLSTTAAGNFSYGF